MHCRRDGTNFFFHSGRMKGEDIDPKLMCPIMDYILPCFPRKVRRKFHCGVQYDNKTDAVRTLPNRFSKADKTNCSASSETSRFTCRTRCRHNCRTVTMERQTGPTSRKPSTEDRGFWKNTRHIYVCVCLVYFETVIVGEKLEDANCQS